MIIMFYSVSHEYMVIVERLVFLNIPSEALDIPGECFISMFRIHLHFHFSTSSKTSQTYKFDAYLHKRFSLVMYFLEDVEGRIV